MHRLYKKEKLCGRTAVEALFVPNAEERGIHSALAYPLRMVWRHNARRHNDADIRFVITVPKRRLRHAVDRVTTRRRIREAYRLLRPQSPLRQEMESTRRLDVAFVYVGNGLEPYARIRRAMQRLLSRLPSAESLAATTATISEKDSTSAGLENPAAESAQK